MRFSGTPDPAFGRGWFTNALEVLVKLMNPFEQTRNWENVLPK
jgi:hypothetical protein